MAEGALAGIKLIELGSGVSAPYCSRLFADYGAEVVKVEWDGEMDISREWGPFRDDRPDPERSGLYHFLNTNKRSIRLDPRVPAERATLLDLIERADVVVENHPPGRMAEWGLGYEQLAVRNPGLVMISITPFGQTGPYAHWKGHDLNAFHLSGASSRYCGRPNEMPLAHGTFAADFFGAVGGAAWGLAATLGRENVGAGQHVDVSCAEIIAATFVGAQNIGAFAQDGVFDKRTGIGMSLCAPATIMPCRDGHVWMLAIEPAQWNGLRKVMGDPDWAKLEMFQDMFTRAENSDLVYSMIGEWAQAHDKMEIMNACQAEGCPVTAVFTVEEAATHPHLRERGYVIERDDPALGPHRTLGAPFKLAATPGGPERPAPALDQHCDEILRDWRDAPTSGERTVSKAGGADATRKLPLEGVRVANFGWVWAGPVVGQTLSFLGAEVYKVESYARVDMMRTLPPFAGPERDPNRSLSNHACWAGNGSVRLNLKKPEARELARALVAESDVVIENFGPGVMDRFGLGYEDLRAIKPDVIMFSMPAAGLDGPMREVRTYGLSLTSTTGLDSLVGYEGGPPIPVENAYADPFNGVFGAFAILTALAHRRRTGEGQLIDFSQQEAVMQMAAPAFMDYSLNGRVAGPIGNKHPLARMAPHGVFPCRGEDRWISLVVADDAEWSALVEAMGRPEWAIASSLETLAGRLEAIALLHAEISEWTRDYDDRALADRLQAAGIAAAPVLTVGDLLTDPHFRARETFVEVEHPLGFLETIYGAYVKTSRSEARIRPGPAIGQDDDHVFRELLGLSEERYRRLREDEVIF